jgi:pSer/pThr/pTyr-binding forkhead associated (FHA) protein
MALGAHFLSPAEHKAMLEAERRGRPFLAYRDGLGDLRFTDLGDRDGLVIGRIAGNDVVLDWDRQVSRSHAQLERVSSDWMLVDDGLSRNGSHVNGERILGRRRLSDGAGAGQAEVGQVGVIALADQHVVRLDVAVHEPDRVRGVERIGHLLEQVERASRVEPALADQLDECGAVDQAHRQVEAVLGFARVVDRHDVRVLEQGLGAALAPEARVALGVGPCAVGHELERDDASGIDVAGPEYRAHAAPSEQPLDAVAPHHRVPVQRHRVPR